MKRPPAGARASRPSASHSRAACTRHTLVHLQHRATSNARCPTVRWSSMPSEAHVVAQFRGHRCGRADSQHGKARAVRSFGPSSPRRMRIPCLDSPRAAYIWQVSMEPSKASTQKENGKLTANRSKGGRCAQNARRNVQYLGRACAFAGHSPRPQALPTRACLNRWRMGVSVPWYILCAGLWCDGAQRAAARRAAAPCARARARGAPPRRSVAVECIRLSASSLDHTLC